MEPATSLPSSSNCGQRDAAEGTSTGRQLLDNSKPALAQPSKEVGYQREWEELLVLRDLGSDGKSGVGSRWTAGGESLGRWGVVGHSGMDKDGHRESVHIVCLKYNSTKLRAQQHPHVLAPLYHATHVEYRTGSRNLDAVPTPTASPLALLLQVLRLNPPQLSPGTPHGQASSHATGPPEPTAFSLSPGVWPT